MNKKENTLKKAGIGLLTTAIISSQMIANVPFNVLAAQTATTTKSAPNATTQSQKLGATEIQLENTEFNGPSGWHPIFATEPAEVSDAQGSYWLSGPSVLNGTFEGQPNPYGSHIHDMGPAHAVTWFSGNGVVHIGADYLALASPNPAYGIAQAFTTIPGHKYSFTYTASYDGISDMYWATNYVVAFSNYSGSVDDMRTSTTSSPIFMTTPKMAEGTPQTVTFTATSTQTYLQLEERGIYDNGDAVTFSNISGITDLDADSTAPVINAGDKTLAVGDSFDPKTDVTASDDTDGDITSKIQVTANNVDTSKAGTYNVTYSVADAAGNTITKTITVTVQAAADTTAPTITASDKTLMVGDSFDPKADVTANDDTDGDLTSKVTVTANNVDTSKAGTYNVTYSVTDTAGNVGTKTIQVIVNSNLQITINPLTDKDTVITGTGTPGRRVSFYDWTTFSFIPDEYTGAVIDASGNYNFPLSDYLVAGHDIAAILKDDQNIQARTTVTHVEDTTKPVIAASDKTLTVGDSFDPKADVTANDDTDGDLTSKVTVTANNVDTSKAGTYNVSYSVTDAAGNTATKTITVIVQAAADTTKPVITASDRTIAVGDSFYAKEGVTASDDRDGDLTSKVEVTASDVDASKAGTYHVTFSVTDAAGNTATKTITVIVQASADTTKPVITASDRTIAVGDSFYAKEGVTASDDRDGDLTSDVTVTASDVDASKAGTYHVTFSVTDAAGNTATKTITVIVQAADTTKPVITASDRTIAVGDSFYAKEGVTASDDRDGDLTSKVEVTASDVDASKAGTYHVTFSVTDAAGNTATKTITVIVQAAADTTKPVITASDRTIAVGDSFYAKEGVTASDDRDGDLTSDVTVTASDVDASKAGTYHVTFSVTDAAGNTATKTITVTVTSNEKPVIVANNVSLAKGSTFDPYAYATASDAEDGDLSSKISVISNTVDTTKAGTYTVSYSVTDTDGNSVQKTIQVTITSDDKPVINAANQTVTAGDTFNPYTNVTATDAEDGDLTSKVKVLSSNVNTEVPGTYSVVYSVTDSDSNTTTKTITVTVTGAADTTKPVINASNKTLNEGDSFDPKAGVTATDDIDGNLTSKVTVTANNVDTSKAGTYNVTYRVTDTAGNTAIKTITVTVQASTTQGTITANAFTIGQDSYITGDITGGITKINMIINGKTYPAIPVSGTNYQYYANGKILSVNDTVTMVAYGANGKEFSRTNVVVKKVVVPTAGTITANDFTIGKDGYVTGNVTGDVAKVGLIVNGKALSMIPAADGSYRYYANGKILSVNDTVTVVGYDAKGKELDRANVVVKKVVVPTTGTITANDFTIGKDGYVTGNVTGDVEKVGLIVNGEELSVIPAADGSYKYYANGKILSVNDTVTVVGYDAKGKELDRTNVPVKKVVVPTAGTITVNDFTVDKDGYITGNVTGDVAKVGLIVNGKALSVIPAADGNYRYYVGNNINSVNDTATMIAYDAKGKELDRANVSIKKMETPTTGTITANDFTVGEDGYITGNVTGDVAKVGMMVNGKELSVIPAADGTYKYYVGNNIQSVNDTVTMIAYDAKGKELNRTTVRLHADNVAVGTVTAKDYTIGSSYIEGTYTGEVSSIGVIVNGKATSKTTAKNTPYQYYIANQVTSVNDDVYVVIYDVKGREMNRVKVNIQQPTDNSVGTITTNTFTIGEDNYVKGSLTGDVTRVSMVVNGEEYSKIGASGSTYQYYANGKILSVNDTVTMIAYNVNGKELDRTNVQLKKAEVVTTGTITADDFNFGGKDAYIHGATTGDVTTVKMLVNGEAASQKAVNEDGTYDYYTGSNISSANDVVEMVGYDASGKELDRTTVKLIASQGTITVEPFQVGGSDAYMHGTATGAVKKVQLIVNGVAQNLAFVQEDGTFKYYAKPVTSTSDTAVMVALDEFGQELDRQTVTLTSATGSVTANAYTVGGTDRYIHGTATGTVKKVGLEVNGVVGASQALVQADGTYQYFAGSQVTSASDKVSIIGYDANGKEIDRTDVALISN